MKHTLKTLDKIQKIETPPFLYTRVESKINEAPESFYSLGLIRSLSFMLLILAVANFSVLKSDLLAQNTSKNDIDILVEDIDSSNQIYYE